MQFESSHCLDCMHNASAVQTNFYGAEYTYIITYLGTIHLKNGMICSKCKVEVFTVGMHSGKIHFHGSQLKMKKYIPYISLP